MFVRKKKNRSGTTSVVIVDKSSHQFRELKTIGVSSDEKTIAELYQSGKKMDSSQWRSTGYVCTAVPGRRRKVCNC